MTLGPTPNDAADIAVNGELARAMGVSGSGIKIGIISDSFDNLAYETNPSGKGYDTYQDDVAAGYLPGGIQYTDAPPDSDGVYTGTDEGRAMAQLVYETAPGAQINFAAAGNSSAAMAAAVQQLEDDGDNIIIDDVSESDEPTFQITGPLDTVIENFIDAGGDYFSAAGNSGGAYYQGPLTAAETVIPGGDDSDSSEVATFGDGQDFETITTAAFSGTKSFTFSAAWNAPVPYSVTGEPLIGLIMTDSNGNQLEPTSFGETTSGFQISYTLSPSTTYRLYAPLDEGASLPSVFRITSGKGLATFGTPTVDPTYGDEAGHNLTPGVNVVGAVNVTNTPSQGVSAPIPEQFSQYGPGELLLDSQGNPISPTAAGAISYTAPDGSITSVSSSFAPFFGTSAAAPVAAAVAALMLQADPSLTPAQVTELLQESAIPMGNGPQVGAGLIQANIAVELAEEMACFAAGTRIATVDGARPVEDLKVGDLILTARGIAAPVKWIGHRRVDFRRHRALEKISPIRIAAHTFGPSLPVHDLYLSPDHAVFAEDVLIPVKYLINGDTIRQVAVDVITYFHVELDRHDVILAEGLPTESYLEMGCRSAFANGGAVIDAHPRFTPEPADVALYWEAKGCAPLVVTGPIVDRLRQATGGQTMPGRRTA